METTLASRIIEARNYARLTQEQLAAKVRKLLWDTAGEKKEDESSNGFTQQQLSKLERDIDKSTGLIVHIAVACGVSPRWLAMGDGPKVQNKALNLSNDALEIALAYEQLDSNNQNYFRGLMAGLKKTFPESGIRLDLPKVAEDTKPYVSGNNDK